MRRTRTTVIGSITGLVLLVATACYPPSQTPTDQPIPPGGRVVATAPVLTELWIEDATDDLSTILYRRNDFLISSGDPIPYRFWVYDDTTGTTTEVPVGRAEYGTAGLAADGRSVVFASNDPHLQVGPTAVNCAYEHGPWIPDTPTYCRELYLYDLDTGQTRQLTGLDGSSEAGHASPTFTPDGLSIDFTMVSGTPFGGPVWTYHRLDLATGQIEDHTPPVPTTSWDRGTHVVEWDGTLTSTDKATGTVTTLWSDPGYYVASATDDGRLIVVSDWETERRQVFRLIDTDTGSIRSVTTPWISEDGSRYATVQVNVAPDGIDRLVIAPLQG